MFLVPAHRAISWLGWASVLLLGCTRGPAVTFETKARSLTVQRPALYPETIEYEKSNDRFLLGSFREGAVYQVDQAGTASLLVDDPRLCSVLGIAVDEARGRLWAVNSNLGASIKPCAVGPKKLAGVGVYDLKTGKPVDYVDLAPLLDGPHLLNGIALDTSGNAFVTDSFSPVIYKVTPGGHASVFLKDERFAGNAINLNGLIVHPDGYLIVIKKSDGALYKVPLDRPTTFTRIALDRRLVGGDGLTLIDDRSLVVVANRTPEHSSNAAYALSSEDGWASARVAAEQDLGDVYPTTAALRNGTLYVVQSKLNELIAAPPALKQQFVERAAIRPIGRVSSP
jgi:hypothetical protein